MHECGAGYDCASLNEIQEALRFVKRGDVGGVAPTPAPFVPDILFANPIKEPQSIQQAAAPIPWMNWTRLPSTTQRRK
jgi:diaminopimelate decarboxylase